MELYRCLQTWIVYYYRWQALISKLHGVAYKGELKEFYLKFIYNNASQADNVESNQKKQLPTYVVFWNREPAHLYFIYIQRF